MRVDISVPFNLQLTKKGELIRNTLYLGCMLRVTDRRTDTLCRIITVKTWLIIWTLMLLQSWFVWFPRVFKGPLLFYIFSWSVYSWQDSFTDLVHARFSLIVFIGCWAGGSSFIIQDLDRLYLASQNCGWVCLRSLIYLKRLSAVYSMTFLLCQSAVTMVRSPMRTVGI